MPSWKFRFTVLYNTEDDFVLSPTWYHDLNHTAATLLMGRGVHPKPVQKPSATAAGR